MNGRGPSGGGARRNSTSPPAEDVVEEFAREHPEIAVAELAPGVWNMGVPGEIRRQLAVTVAVTRQDWTASCFLLRGPTASRADMEGFLRLLLRKNAGLRWARFALDDDGDVVLIARLPRESLTADTLAAALAELLSVSEGAFEALVHLAYPGVFPPLPRFGTGP